MHMTTLRVLSIIALFSVVAVSPAPAQFPEDALRFATPGFGVGARSLGLGNAYTGVANDYSALYWNPAGLAQMDYGEFSFGLSHFNHKNTGTLYGASGSSSNNATNLNALGLTFPVEVRRGSLVFGFGFQRQANFTTGLSFEGFNPVSSIIQAYAPNGGFYPADMTLPEYLLLADIDTTTGRFISPITDSLTQAGEVLEGGGINHWSFGGAIDVAKNVSVGVTLSYATGTYKYDRTYTETDTRHVWEVNPDDLDQLTIDEFVESDIAGFGAKLGLMYRVPERFRFGLTVKMPVTYQIKEDFGTTATAVFDDGFTAPSDGPYETAGSDEYDVITPWVFSAGASVILGGELMLSGDVEYTDWTQLEFSSAPSALIALNKDIKKLFRPTADLRGGAEYLIAPIGVRVRGGFMYSPSPFDGDPSSFDRKTVTGGLGLQLSESTMLDLAYAHGWWKSFRVNYDGPSRVDEDVKSNTVLATFSYRF
jgi:long-subunit fatty acid transport protein